MLWIKIMPSHPDRVRRNYHDIKIGETKDIVKDEDVIYIKVSKQEIATAMSGTEIFHNIVRAIKNGIFLRWRK